MSEYLNEGAPTSALAPNHGGPSLWQQARGWVLGGCLATTLVITLCSAPFVLVTWWGWHAVTDGANGNSVNGAPVRSYADPLDCNAQGLSVMAWWEDGQRRYQCIAPLQ